MYVVALVYEFLYVRLHFFVGNFVRKKLMRHDWKSIWHLFRQHRVLFMEKSDIHVHPCALTGVINRGSVPWPVPRANRLRHVQCVRSGRRAAKRRWRVTVATGAREVSLVCQRSPLSGAKRWGLSLILMEFIIIICLKFSLLKIKKKTSLFVSFQTPTYACRWQFSATEMFTLSSWWRYRSLCELFSATQCTRSVGFSDLVSPWWRDLDISVTAPRDCRLNDLPAGLHVIEYSRSFANKPPEYVRDVIVPYSFSDLSCWQHITISYSYMYMSTM